MVLVNAVSLCAPDCVLKCVIVLFSADQLHSQLATACHISHSPLHLVLRHELYCTQIRPYLDSGKRAKRPLCRLSQRAGQPLGLRPFAYQGGPGLLQGRGSEAAEVCGAMRALKLQLQIQRY